MHCSSLNCMVFAYKYIHILSKSFAIQFHCEYIIRYIVTHLSMHMFLHINHPYLFVCEIFIYLHMFQLRSPRRHYNLMRTRFKLAILDLIIALIMPDDSLGCGFYCNSIVNKLSHLFYFLYHCSKSLCVYVDTQEDFDDFDKL